jgi:integrase
MRGENGEERLRDDNPFTGLPLPKKARYVRPMLHDAGEVETFLGAAAEVDADAHDLLLCMIGTGLRWGEAAGLRADAVTLFADGSGGIIDVWQVAAKRQGKLPDGLPRFYLRDETKTPAGQRDVPFGARVARMFAARPAIGAALMFTNPADGLPADMWNPLTFRNKVLTPIQDLAIARGLSRRVSPQGLRKTWVNNLYEAKVNPVTTAATAGHTDPSVALRHYTQATTRGHDDVRAATGRLLVA